jgi:hypothetical protein
MRERYRYLMGDTTDKKVGLLIGREWSWPSALIAQINDRGTNLRADFVQIGHTMLDSPCVYDIIIDRMSREIPYYRTYTKYAALSGSYIINNPFVTSSDDKFFGVALARRFEVRTPRTVALPNKRVETQNVPESFRNLVYPMDWQGIIDYVGVPAILKDINTGGRRVAHRVNNVDDLIRWYDESDTLTVVLQTVIESDDHVHVLVVGGDKALAMRYSREERRYSEGIAGLPFDVAEQLGAVAREISLAYSYDINMVEFAIGDDGPFLINASNPTPDLDINLLTAGHFHWSVEAVADLVIELASKPHRQFENYTWQRFVRAHRRSK